MSIALKYIEAGALVASRLLRAGLAVLGAGMLLALCHTFAGIRTVGKSVSRSVQTAMGIMGGLLEDLGYENLRGSF